MVSSRSTATLSPCTTLNTPSGSPASCHSRASHSAAVGTFSEGLRTTVLPAAMATGKNHIGTMAGKLNGLITATGPSGWRTECTSTPVEAFSVNEPLSRCGIPQANSTTTSWPRATSPAASASTLPCSAVMIAASSGARAFSSSRKANSTWVRRASEASRQAGKASAAAATTWSTSSVVARGTDPVTAPVAGLVTSPQPPGCPAYSWPALQWVSTVGASSAVVCAVGLRVSVTVSPAVVRRRAASMLAAGGRVGGRRNVRRARCALRSVRAHRRLRPRPARRPRRPPEVVGATALDRPVRWVHVSERLDGADLLDGGELVLATGLLIETRADGAERLVRDLEDAGAAGLLVELLPGRETAERLVRAAAARSRMPVVLLHRRVRFVEVTEVVHSALVAGHLARVEAQQRAHELFTELSLRAADPPEVVASAARTTGHPVVLEDLAGRVLVVEPLDHPVHEVLQDLAVPTPRRPVAGGDRGHRRAGPGPAAGRHGTRAATDPALTAMVLDRAAQTLAINEMTRRDQGVLARQARATCLDELRAGLLVGAAAQARAAALGLTPRARSCPWPCGSPTTARRRRRTSSAAPGRCSTPSRTRRPRPGPACSPPPAGRTCSPRSCPGLPGRRRRLRAPPGRRAATGPASRRRADPRLAGAGPGTGPGVAWWMGVGDPEADLLAAVAALDGAVHVADSAASIPDLVPRPFHRADDVRVRGVLATLADDPVARAFVVAELGDLRLPERAEDLRLLEQYLELGGSKTELARRTFLSRPTLYARLRRLSAELGASLDAGESRTSLHVAVLLLRQEQARSRGRA